MEYLRLGDEIDYNTYNGLVYLLRKFKRLTSDLRLGNNTISSDYGTYTFNGGLTNVDGNYIIESPVTITSNDVLLNCFYSFNFTVIDVNTSGVVNRRVVTVTGYTGDDGVLSITLPTDLIESDEVILPNFKVDIVFDEHEYYTPMAALNIALSVEKQYIVAGETNTITATVTDESGTAKSGVLLNFEINGVIYDTETTDSNGEASITYTGLGTVGKVTVTVSQSSIVFYDGGVEAEYTGNRIILKNGTSEDIIWLASNGDVLIDWGDGTTNTVNNPKFRLSHGYNDSQSEHTITLIGDITRIGDNCFWKCTGLTSIVIPDSVTSLGSYCFRKCTGLTSVVIPDSVTSLGSYCFEGCTGLTSVVIPDSVTSLGSYCFEMCTGLVDYQLYWTGNNIITYDSNNMQNNPDTIFTIPQGETSNYIAKGYPRDRLRERGVILTNININVPLNLVYSDDFLITGVLTDNQNNPIDNKEIQLKANNQIIDTALTNNDGEVEFTQCPTSMNPLTFQLIFDGEDIYSPSYSQEVIRQVHKETSVLTVNNPLNDSRYYTDETITVDGVLTDDDGEIMANKTININI